jgi:hypothetical protein
VLRAADVVTPVVFVDEVIGLFPTVDQAVRSVDPADLAITTAYDAEGRRLVLKEEGGQTVLDEWASGEPRPEELHAHLAASAEELGLGGRDPTSLSLAELVDAHVRASALPPRPSPFVLLVGLCALVVGLVVFVLLL